MSERDASIDQLFEPGNEAHLKAYLRVLHPVDISDLYSIVDPDHWPKIAASLTTEEQAEVVANLDESQREFLGKVLSTSELAHLVDEMETDDAADVLADLPEDKSAAILPQLEDRADIESLLAYPEDSAGGIMQTELCRVLEGSTVRDTIDSIRQAREDIEDIFGVYVVDDLGRLRGSIDLADLLLAPSSQPIAQFVEPIEVRVTADIDQEDVALLFRKYDVVSMPVLDPEGVLLGRITFDDIHDVLEEEASEDIMTMAGASPEELVYGSRFFHIAMFRLPWLITSLLGSLVTTQLVPMFARIEGQDAMVLAAFVPVMMAMSGNVGSQSAMIITRGMAIGRVELSGVGRAFLREISVGMIMGVVAGVVVGGFSHFMHADFTLGLALGVAMVLSMSASTTVGVGAPIMFHKLGVDPAIAAGPLVTTTCDVLGVSTYLAVVMLMLA